MRDGSRVESVQRGSRHFLCHVRPLQETLFAAIHDDSTLHVRIRCRIHPIALRHVRRFADRLLPQHRLGLLHNAWLQRVQSGRARRRLLEPLHPSVQHHRSPVFGALFFLLLAGRNASVGDSDRVRSQGPVVECSESESVLAFPITPRFDRGVWSVRRQRSGCVGHPTPVCRLAAQ